MHLYSKYRFTISEGLIFCLYTPTVSLEISRFSLNSFLFSAPKWQIRHFRSFFGRKRKRNFRLAYLSFSVENGKAFSHEKANIFTLVYLTENKNSFRLVSSN